VQENSFVESQKRRTWSIARPMAIGVFAVVAVFGAVGVWGASVEIAGAVLGNGKVEVSTNMTAVQHPIGGVIADIRAHNGDSVEEGQIVLRLDDTGLRSDLKLVETDLYEALASEARLEAVLEGRREIRFDAALKDAAARDSQIRALAERQERQLATYYESLDTQAHLLSEQIRQVEEQVAGSEAELAAKFEARTPIKKELEQVRDLADKGLVKLGQLYALQKEDFDNEGEIGQITAKIAELKGKISELKLSQLALIPDARDKISEDLNKVRPERARAAEKRNALLDSLTKLDIRAPIAGRVHDSKVQGERSVVVAADPLMFIVPRDKPFVVGVRVAATDIDQVFVGQPASVKFLAFNRRRLPIILGTVSRISPNAFQEATTLKFYYDVEISLRPEELAKLGGHDLVPGMPVEAFMATESRTPLNYVLKPVMDYLDRSFRDA
jgi:HlyD family secretion protein